MKNLIILTTTALLLSCNQYSKKEVKEAKKDLKNAEKELNNIIKDENKTAHSKSIPEWKSFKIESDIAIAKMERDLIELENTLAKIDNKDKQKIDADYQQARKDISELKDKLEKKNAEFNNTTKAGKSDVNLEAFQRSFRTDLEKVNLSVKRMIKDDRK